MGVGGDEAVEEAGAGGRLLGGAAARGKVARVEDGRVGVVFVHCDMFCPNLALNGFVEEVDKFGR